VFEEAGFGLVKHLVAIAIMVAMITLLLRAGTGILHVGLFPLVALLVTSAVRDILPRAFVDLVGAILLQAPIAPILTKPRHPYTAGAGPAGTGPVVADASATSSKRRLMHSILTRTAPPRAQRTHDPSGPSASGRR
jgi:hypothetical protein